MQQTDRITNTTCTKGPETEKKQKLRQSHSLKQILETAITEQPIGKSLTSLVYHCTKCTQCQKMSNILNTF